MSPLTCVCKVILLVAQNDLELVLLSSLLLSTVIQGEWKGAYGVVCVCVGVATGVIKEVSVLGAKPTNLTIDV